MTDTAAIPGGDRIDWLAAAETHRRRFPDTRWGRHKQFQIRRARQYLGQRQEGGSAGTDEVLRRAAIILNATPGAPELERMLGIRLAYALEGEQVKCRDCRRAWLCLPEDPAYDPTGDGVLCGGCMLALTRRDVAVPAIEPSAVAAPEPHPSDTGEIRAIGDAMVAEIQAGPEDAA